jgi:hypothetical protein
VFTVRYGLSPYITQISFVFKGLIHQTYNMAFSRRLPHDRSTCHQEKKCYADMEWTEYTRVTLDSKLTKISCLLHEENCTLAYVVMCYTVHPQRYWFAFNYLYFHYLVLVDMTHKPEDLLQR